MVSFTSRPDVSRFDTMKTNQTGSKLSFSLANADSRLALANEAKGYDILDPMKHVKDKLTLRRNFKNSEKFDDS